MSSKLKKKTYVPTKRRIARGICPEAIILVRSCFVRILIIKYEINGFRGGARMLGCIQPTLTNALHGQGKKKDTWHTQSHNNLACHDIAMYVWSEKKKKHFRQRNAIKKKH